MGKLFTNCLFAGLLALASTQLAAKPDDRHEGVASCAGGTCHGATAPLGDHGIRQDEYFIWQKQDVHAKAFPALANERSRRIGSILGINPQTAPQCLACHTEVVPQHLRGERFLTSDGIGCESCHGASQRWLSEHTRPGISLKEKEQLGMRATWRPQVRAQLCLTCHQGDAQHPITHAMMAAGHPPLLFELDTFASLEPPHYDRDADYAKRKGTQLASRDWATGQMVAAQQFLQGIAAGRMDNGLFPELVHFDCAACHHGMNAGRFVPGRTGATPPGAVPLADTHLHWVGVWLNAMAPAGAAAWQKEWQALQLAMAQSPAAVRTVAGRMAGIVQANLPAVQSQTPSAAQLRQMLASVAALAKGTRAGDFASAQQAAMASVVLANSLEAQGQPVGAGARAAIDALYASAKSADNFSMTDYHRALDALSAAGR